MQTFSPAFHTPSPPVSHPLLPIFHQTPHNSPRTRPDLLQAPLSPGGHRASMSLGCPHHWLHPCPAMWALLPRSLGAAMSGRSANPPEPTTAVQWGCRQMPALPGSLTPAGPAGGLWWPVAVGHAGAPTYFHQREPKCHESWSRHGHGRPSLRRRGAGPRHSPGRPNGDCHPSVWLAKPTCQKTPFQPPHTLGRKPVCLSLRGPAGGLAAPLPGGRTPLPALSSSPAACAVNLRPVVSGNSDCSSKEGVRHILGQPRIVSLTSEFFPVQIITQHHVQTQSGDEETLL